MKPLLDVDFDDILSEEEINNVFTSDSPTCTFRENHSLGDLFP